MARKIGSRYTAHQILGRGSAGTVWLGEGPEGPVAIKLLREDLASDQELVGRFVQERTALLGLDHPHVVGVRDLVVDGNDLALVMDLVRGTDLRTRLERERRLAPEAAVAIVADVADGLAAAHAAGVVHRDVKPENVLLDMQGPLGPGGSHPALLTDFGVAKLDRLAAPHPGHEDHRHPGLPRPRDRRGPAAARLRRHLRPGDRPVRAARRASRRSAAATRARCCAAMSRRRCVPLPGIPDELWQLLVQCLAKAPASRLRAVRAGGAAAGAAAARWPACRRWTSTSRTRSRRTGSRTASRRRRAAPTSAGAPRAPAAARRGAAGPRRGPRLQPRHPHEHAGARRRTSWPAARTGTARAPRAPGAARAPGSARDSRPPSAAPDHARRGGAAVLARRWASAAGWPWRRRRGRRRRRTRGTRRRRRRSRPDDRAGPALWPRTPCGRPPGRPAAPCARFRTVIEQPGAGPRATAVTLEAWQSSMYPKS